MHWKTKAKIFRILSALPMGSSIHYGLQLYATKEVPRPVAYLDQLFVAAEKIVQDIKLHSSIELDKSNFLEIGAGRDLAVAVALRLLGVKHVTCIDISPLAKPYLINRAAQYFSSKLGMKSPTIKNWKDVEQFNIRYIAPNTLQSANLEDQSIDCFYTTDTLEHIPQQHLLDIFSVAKSKMKTDGISIHFIDYSDHYARDNGDLSRFNFLTYCDADWIKFNPSLHYVNRMRHSQYLIVLSEAGFITTNVEPTIEETQSHILDNLAGEFKDFSHKDLFTIRAKVIAKPALN